MNSRRDFLKSSAGLAASMAVGPLAGAQTLPITPLPMVKFGDVEISRLVLGCNQFYGFSHFNKLLDQLMKDWNTPEQICKTLLNCQQNGINAYQCSANESTRPHWPMFRAQGGNMNLIAVHADIDHIDDMLKSSGARIVYHHGEVTDRNFRDGKMDQVQEYTKRLRQTGVRVGIGTHKPEVVEYAEERGWDVDFYVLCAYNRTRTREEFTKILGVMPAGEIYLETDPAHAFKVARQTPKTCFLFKILAAGRLAGSPQVLDKAFADAFTNIKPQDCVIVGMFPRFQDQVKDNADRVRRILGVNS